MSVIHTRLPLATVVLSGFAMSVLLPLTGCGRAEDAHPAPAASEKPRAVAPSPETKPAHRNAATPDEALAQQLAAVQARDYEAFLATLPEPWRAGMTRQHKLQRDIVEYHQKLQAAMDRKFGKPPSEEPSDFASAAAGYLGEMEGRAKWNPGVVQRSAKILSKEAISLPKLTDEDGEPLKIDEAAKVEVETVASRGDESRTFKRMMLGLKIDGRWGLLPEVLTLSERAPADRFHAECQRARELCDAYQTALREVNDGLYKRREEVEAVMLGTIKELHFADPDARNLAELPAPDRGEPSEPSLPSPQVTLAQTDGAAKLRIDWRDVDFADAKRALASLKEGRESREVRLLISPDVKSATLERFLEAFLDAGFKPEQLVIVSMAREQDGLRHFEQLGKTLGELKGRLRLFARLTGSMGEAARRQRQEDQKMLDIAPESLDDPTDLSLDKLLDLPLAKPDAAKSLDDEIPLSPGGK